MKGNYIATALFHLCIQACGEAGKKLPVSDLEMPLKHIV
jgi:hypothetical protein